MKNDLNFGASKKQRLFISSERKVSVFLWDLYGKMKNVDLHLDFFCSIYIYWTCWKSQAFDSSIRVSTGKIDEVLKAPSSRSQHHHLSAQDLTVRLGVCTRQGHSACIRDHFGPTCCPLDPQGEGSWNPCVFPKVFFWGAQRRGVKKYGVFHLFPVKPFGESSRIIWWIFTTRPPPRPKQKNASGCGWISMVGWKIPMEISDSAFQPANRGRGRDSKWCYEKQTTEIRILGGTIGNLFWLVVRFLL